MPAETFVFFGIAGSGKGTQVKLLMDFLKSRDGREIVYAYPGNEYRKLLESGNFTGSLIRESMEKGHLQPNFLTDSIVASIIYREISPEKHLIADGYPRTPDQSETFAEMMRFFERSNIKIIYIELSKEEAMKRNLLRGRPDDNKEGIEKRFDEYVNKVVPAMDYFKANPDYQLISINGDQSIENVHQDIIKALGYSDSGNLSASMKN